NEVFGAVGYRDGGKRFITIAPPNPQAQQQQQMQQGLALQNMLAEIAKKRAQAAHAQAQAGHAQMLGTAAMAKVGLEHRPGAADERNASFDPAHQLLARLLAAHDQGHRHAMEIANARDVAAPDVGGQMSDVGSAASGLTSDVGNQTSGEPEGLDLFQQLIAAL